MCLFRKPWVLFDTLYVIMVIPAVCVLDLQPHLCVL